MPNEMQYPFRIYGNKNFGSQYDHRSFKGEWLSCQRIGAAEVLPEVNLHTGNISVSSPCYRANETAGDFLFGFTYQSQATPAWQLSIPSIIRTGATLQVKEADGSM